MSVKPTNVVKPASLAKLQKDIETRQNAVAKIDRQQYEEMLKGQNPDSLNALKAHHERELSNLKEVYAQAMGLGEKKPKNQLLASHSSRMDDAYRQAIQEWMEKGNAGQQVSDTDDTLFWDGFGKGLGLKEGDNKLEALKAQREAALADLKMAYAQAMGLGGKKPKKRDSRMDDAYRQAIQQRMESGSAGKQVSDTDDTLFWKGFRKGLGLKEGEEVGQEGVKGSLRNTGFSVQDTAMHKPGLDDETSQSSGEGGQLSSFVYGYSEDNPLLDDEEESSVEPDPTVDDHVYITEEEYDVIMADLDAELERRSNSTDAMPTNEDIYIQQQKLEENREWSICTDMVVETEPGSDQGLRIDIDSEEFDELKGMLGGSYEAAGYLADYILDEYGDKFVDSRTRDSIIAEIYIHDYLNSLIPDDLDYSSITNSNMAEALAAWKLTAQELNLVYDGDANSLFAGIISIATGIAPFDFIDESVLQQATFLFMLNDYRDRYGIGALVDFFQPY